MVMEGVVEGQGGKYEREHRVDSSDRPDDTGTSDVNQSGEWDDDHELHAELPVAEGRGRRERDHELSA